MLLGHPVAHSLSPLFQNAALRAAGISLAVRGARCHCPAISRALLKKLKDLARSR